jgi:hypothetical protein
LSNLPVTPSNDNPPSDMWQRWRTQPGRNATVHIVLVPIEVDPLPVYLPHYVGLLHVEEIRKEIGPDQAFLPFYLASIPHRWRNGLAPGQKFAMSMLRTWDERWEMHVISRLEP